MDLKEIRRKIDEIDEALLMLFQQRMDIAAEVAHYKRLHNLPVRDPVRERQKLDDLINKVPKDRAAYITALYSLLFEFNRAEQERLLNPD